MSPEKTAEFYNGTKIMLNMHRSTEDQSFNQNSSSIPASSPNPRMFEICSTGVFQLTDVRGDLPSFYEPGIEIATYDSPAERFMQILI